MESINNDSDIEETYFAEIFRFYEFTMIPKVRTFFKENLTNHSMENSYESS